MLNSVDSFNKISCFDFASKSIHHAYGIWASSVTENFARNGEEKNTITVVVDGVGD